jgi:D-alanyl-D-alanine carboxypeptidase/D-alanyl-D-alanine-endopeptidase (penicillin-binding protein 4)
MKTHQLAPIVCAVCLLAQTASAAPQNKIVSNVAAILNRPQMRASQLGVAFYDLDAERMLYERDARKYFVAASTTKVLTESTSLALLGPDYRFSTVSS